MLDAVRNDRIEFITMRPPGSQFATLERRVVVTGPAELVELSEKGDVQVLEDLINLLKEPDCAWAAEVLLSAMTRREEKIVDSFATVPEEWWESLGKTAYDRWFLWLNQTSATLMWDPDNKVYCET